MGINMQGQDKDFYLPYQWQIGQYCMVRNTRGGRTQLLDRDDDLPFLTVSPQKGS